MNELEIIQHSNLDGITLFVDTLDYRTPHIHPEWELLWVLDEKLSVICENQEIVALPGDILLFEPDFPHEFRKMNGSCTFLCIQVTPGSMHLPFVRLEGRRVNEYLSDQQLRWLRDMLLQTARSYFLKQQHYELLCAGNIALIMHRLLTTLPSHTMTREESLVHNRKNARLKRLIRFVDLNYMNKIRLADFAAEEGCTVSYLSHFIKDSMNQTFQEYVNSVRFGRACDLLESGARKMLDVCMESGFSDYRYFSKTFKQYYGLTPEQYCRSRTPVSSAAPVRRSAGSVERFYSPEESVYLLNRLIR